MYIKTNTINIYEVQSLGKIVQIKNAPINATKKLNNHNFYSNY